MAGIPRRPRRRQGHAAADATSCSACSSAPRTCTSACRWSRRRTTSTRSRPRTSRSSPATRSSSAATAPGSAGTPRSPCTAPSAPASASAATSRPTPRPPPSTRSATTGSSAARTTPAAATRSSTRATPPPACTPAPSSRAASARTSSKGFRQEKSQRPARRSSSYPHPRLMPEFWQFPTVSMGLGPINAIYQAQSNRYLTNRGIKDASDQQVWAFLGDGEMDEVESRGALQWAANDEPRQPELRHQLQPAAPRRPGARQRQDHPGARELLPRRRLERHQGRLGPRVGRAARPRHRRARSSTS